MAKISIIGTGYVGLVTGTCFAAKGHHVICVDCDTNKIERLNRGEIPIYEPGLADLVESSVQSGHLKFTTRTTDAVNESDFIFIAVSTPPRSDGSVDLTFVEKVARDI